MKKLLLSLMMMVLTVSLIAQPQLSFQFSNAQLTDGGATMEFDVDIMADAPGVWLGEHTVSFVYNTVGFGENIVPTNVVVTKGTVMAGDFSGSDKYVFAGVANTFPNTLSASCLINLPGFDPNALFHNEIPTTFTSFMHFAITVADPGELAGIVFTEFLMNGQQYHFSAANTTTLCADPNLYIGPDLSDFPLGTVVVGTDWTGAIDSDWDNAGNWSAGVPGAGDDATVGVTANDPVIDGSASTAALTVAAGVTVTVGAFGDLTTNGLFTCDGDFVIMTDAGGFSGSFIDLGGLAGGGMFYMDRHITCFGDGDPNNAEEPIGWHYISAPIDGVTTDDMLDFYVNAWNETSGMWTNYAGETPCIPYSPAETLENTEVWSVKYDQLWPYDFTSDPCPQPVNGPVVMYSGAFTALHTGAYSTPTSNSGGLYGGWNLVANPYPSGLDMNAIVWDPAAVPGGALYDGCPGNYSYWTPAIGAYSMPVGNGFFTEFTGAGSFDLTGAERAHGPDFFYKEDITSLLTLEATGDETSDITHIRFMEDAEAGFAKDGDFHKLFVTTEGLAQIYTTAGDDKLAINALPETPVVPMGFTSATSGEYTISAIETSEFANVVLEDRTTGEQTDLLAGSYTFNYTVNDDADRFFVHFTPLGIGDNLANSIDIWSNDHKIYVQAPAINGDIVVFNMMGQEVIRTEIEPGLNTIPVNDRNSYYVVKVVSSDVARTGKVYVK